MCKQTLPKKKSKNKFIKKEWGKLDREIEHCCKKQRRKFRHLLVQKRGLSFNATRRKSFVQNFFVLKK